MIPKIIHYCWFGRNPKARKLEKCIESWHKFCPDYQFIEWTEDNFDINCCLYVQQAYASKKYAFVSDYARNKVLYEMGGVYVDTDVELLKPIDNLLGSDFCGFESAASVNTGLICGGIQGNWLCKEMLTEYESDRFLLEDGTLNFRTVCARTTSILSLRGLLLEDKTQTVDGVVVYSTNYFNPYEMATGKIKISPETYSIHHYAASWVSEKDRIRGTVYRTIARIFGVKFAEKVRRVFGRNI